MEIYLLFVDIQVMEENIEEQTREVLDNIDMALANAGTDKSKIQMSLYFWLIFAKIMLIC